MRRFTLTLTVALGLAFALSGCGSGQSQLSWSLLSVSGSTLVIDVAGGCDTGPHLHLSESPQQVNVVFTTHSTLSPGQSCADVGQPPQTVHLKAPLGTRALLGCMRDLVNCRHIGGAG